MANSTSNDCFDDWVWSVNWTMASEVAWHSLATRARELGTKQWTDRNEKAPVLFVSVSVVQVNSLFRKLVYLCFQAWALEFKSRDVFISREQLSFSHWKKKKERLRLAVSFEPNILTLQCRGFGRIALCQTEGTHQIVMSTPVPCFTSESVSSNQEA